MQDPNDIMAGAEQSEATSNEQAEPSQAQPTPDGQSEIPEKWRGKSPADIVKAYEEAEKRFHEISSERAALKRDAEEKAQRLYELQSALYQQSLATRPQAEADPLSGIEEEIAQDPVSAIKKLATAIKEMPKRSKEEVLRETRAYQAQDVYARKKSENPDFAKREVDMANLAKRYQHLLKPDRINDPDTIEILDLMSRGARVQDYVKEAEERVRKERDSIKDEKRKAHSESSNSQGDANSQYASQDDFTKLTNDEQEKELRRLEKALGKSNRF